MFASTSTSSPSCTTSTTTRSACARRVIFTVSRDSNGVARATNQPPAVTEERMVAISGTQDFDLQREAAQKLLDEAKKRLEVGFIICRGYTSNAPTGESYVEVLAGVVKNDDGEPFLDDIPLHTTPEKAIAAWEKTACTYATRLDPLVR